MQWNIKRFNALKRYTFSYANGVEYLNLNSKINAVKLLLPVTIYIVKWVIDDSECGTES